MAKTAVCPICGKLYDPRGLRMHIERAHPNVGKEQAEQKIEAQNAQNMRKNEDISIPNEGENDMVSKVVEKEVENLEKDEEKEETRYVACPNCGNMIPEDVSYCHECGCELEWVEEEE